MAIQISRSWGCVVVLVFLFGPAIAMSYILHSKSWLLVPVGIVVLALIIAAIPQKRKIITSTQLADKLERHLLGTERSWDWDDTSSGTFIVEDAKLDQLFRNLWKFDSLKLQEDKDELRAIIAALRRGETPNVRRATYPKPRDRAIIQLHLHD
jgi:hypothetical protein